MPPIRRKSDLAAQGEKNGEAVDPWTRGILKGEANWVQRPPGQAASQANEHERFKDANEPYGHFIWIKNGFLFVENVVGHVAVEADRGRV